MKILVIGGSYFLGRTFTLLSGKEHELYLLNRGTYGINTFPPSLNLHAYQMDRHDVSSLKTIDEEFDVIVDFCAYEKNDIKTILDNVKTKKYIFVSTVDVYERDYNEVIGEEHQFIKDTSIFPDYFKTYVDGKLILEDELKEECLKRNIDFISIRPGNIYGPNNYKPQFYLDNIVKNGQAIYPVAADGYFNLVYVKDIAEAMKRLCTIEKNNHSYNLVPDLLDYKKLILTLRDVVDMEYQEIFLNDQELQQYGIVLPYNYYHDYTLNYDGKKVCDDTGLVYTSLEDGLNKSYNAVKMDNNR